MAEETKTAAECSEMLSTDCAAVPAALDNVLERIRLASENCVEPLDGQRHAPRLVAVSKTKPYEFVLAAYHAGQRHFGESYVKEFVEKSNEERVISEAPDIQWHFIGHLQRNKCKQLITGVKNLWMVETVDSERLATALETACANSHRDEPLRVLVQVNTSGEENKHGCLPEDCVSLARHIIESCPHLKFSGLMTIGALARSLQAGKDDSNPDFMRLLSCRTELCQELCVNRDSLELSMGMTNDMESAIQLGSTNVRVGTAIFGARNYANPTSN